MAQRGRPRKDEDTLVVPVTPEEMGEIGGIPEPGEQMPGNTDPVLEPAQQYTGETEATEEELAAVEAGAIDWAPEVGLTTGETEEEQPEVGLTSEFTVEEEYLGKTISVELYKGLKDYQEQVERGVTPQSAFQNANLHWLIDCEDFD